MAREAGHMRSRTTPCSFASQQTRKAFLSPSAVIASDRDMWSAEGVTQPPTP